MTRGTRGGLIAAGCALVIGLPALARAQGDPPATGDFQAIDDTPLPAWHANGTAATTVTVVSGGTVTFHYDSGNTRHNVIWQDDQPASCKGMPDMYDPKAPGWSGSCTFSAPGTYAFACIVHPDMKGTVVVADAPQATATPTPTPAGNPGATPTPAATPAVPGDAPQSTLTGAVKLASAQRGTRVRGTVTVKGARSRLEVAVLVRRSALSGGTSGRLVRVGRSLRAAAPAGKVAFSVRLTAKARSALRRHRRLAVTVSVALTPPGGRTLTRSLHAMLRPG